MIFLRVASDRAWRTIVRVPPEVPSAYPGWRWPEGHPNSSAQSGVAFFSATAVRRVMDWLRESILVEVIDPGWLDEPRQHERPHVLQVAQKPLGLSQIACLPQTEVHRHQQPRNALRVA